MRRPTLRITPRAAARRGLPEGGPTALNYHGPPQQPPNRAPPRTPAGLPTTPAVALTRVASRSAFSAFAVFPRTPSLHSIGLPPAEALPPPADAALSHPPATPTSACRDGGAAGAAPLPPLALEEQVAAWQLWLAHSQQEQRQLQLAREGAAARRAAALARYLRKKAERCFAKKVRYQSRKRLADVRPRVKGQFVRLADLQAIEGVQALAAAR